MRNSDPPFDALGRDLLVIHPVRRAVSLAMPFVLEIATGEDLLLTQDDRGFPERRSATAGRC